MICKRLHARREGEAPHWAFGRLTVGAPADLVLIDPDLPYVLDKRRLKSRSKNSPFDEARLQGAAVLTLVGGRIVHAADDLAAAA